MPAHKKLLNQSRQKRVLPSREDPDIAVQRYQAFLTTSSEAIWRFELEKPVSIHLQPLKQINLFYKFAYLAECNISFAKLYGYTSIDDLIGKRLGEFLLREEEGNIDYLTAFIKAGYRLTDAESKEKDKDGNIHYFLNNLIGVVEKGYLVRCWGTQRDITKQKSLEEQFYYHSRLLENISDAVISISPDYIIQSWNPGAESLYGWEKEEVLGKHIRDVIPVVKFVNSSLEDVLKSHIVSGSWKGEVIQKRKDGKLLHIMGTSSVVRDDSGKQIGIVAVNRDISSYKESERERTWLLSTVQHQKQRLDDIISDVPGVVWEAYGKPDAKSQRINYVSKHVQKMLGFSVQEWLTTPNFWLTRVHPDDKEQAVKTANYLFENKKSGVNRFRWIRKDGKVIWVDSYSSVITDSAGNPIGMRGVTIDITQRKLAEDALQASEAKFRNLVDLAPDVIFSINCEGIILTLSPTFESLTGWKIKEWVGKHFAGLIHPDDLSFAKEKFIEGLQKPLITPYELRIRTKRGGFISGEFRSSPYFENGVLAGKIGIARDITQRVELEKRKDEFISMASHELKTPITSLKLYTQFLRTQIITEDSAIQNSLERMENQIDRMTALISDMLDLSKIQAGKLTLRKETFFIDELVKSVVETMQRSSTHAILLKGVAHHRVKADRYRIEQVLINLLTNAIKYSPHAEKIIVKMKNTTPEVIVSVQDFGIGIAKEHQQKIFERFYQISDTKHKESSGLGIGLYICNQIIEKNNGRMWVESELNKGSIFSFALPIKE